jgi:hypothetical protein
VFLTCIATSISVDTGKTAGLGYRGVWFRGLLALPLGDIGNWWTAMGTGMEVGSVAAASVPLSRRQLLPMVGG